jgi:lysophospholipid acyltransferase (LPLAT)-like uncharacterized protein
VTAPPAAAAARRRQRRIRWAARLGRWLVRVVAPTWRVREVNAGTLHALRARKEPIIFTFWHGRMLPLLWHHRRQGVAILVSEHGDGEIIARIAEGLGYQTVRGSSTRGSERALLRLIRAVRAGSEVAITPDGPRGPAESFAPGALIVAQRSGAPIAPVACGSRHAWRLKSWDRFMLPRPFARVVVAYGDPVYLRDCDAREAAAQAPRLQRLLRDLTASVDG